MANNDIIVSEMTSATQINTGDLMIMTQPDAQAETGYSTKKGTVLQVANKMLKGTEYTTDLPDFTDKTVLGGLEELKGDLTSLLPVDTASGAIANFDTDLALDLVSCKASIVASQPSGTPTPSNPLAISGYTGVNLTRCGVNLFDNDKLVIASYPYPSMTFDKATYLKAGTYTASINNISNATSWRFGFRFFDLSGNIITSAITNGLVSFVSDMAFSDAYDSNQTCLQSADTTGTTVKITLTADCYIVGCISNGNVGATTTLDYQIETGASASSFVAYNGTTYTIAFGQTVYGGVLDVTNGTLTVTHDNIASYNGESINEPWLSSMDVYTEGGTPTTGAQVVYPLTTPVTLTLTLTPTQVRALVGVNNVFNDTNGNTEVSYKEGIQHYIDKKIAQTQALIL